MADCAHCGYHGVFISLICDIRNYGISYESMQNAGVPKVVLKPDLVSIASFPEIPPPFESVLLFSSVICR